MKTLFTAGLLSLSLLACKDRSGTDEPANDQLPPITQTGANTAGCIINGKILIPKDGINPISGSITKGLEGYVGTSFYTPVLGNDHFSFKITNLSDKGKTYWIYVSMNKISNGLGSYTIHQGVADFQSSIPHPYIFARETDNGISGKTYLSSDNSGTIIISKLTSNICSGTFSGTLYNEDNPSEKIQVTEGRFDINI